MHALLRLAPVALLLLTGLAPTAAPAATCPPANPHVWFLGVVDDEAERADFKQDVFTFEAFLTELRDAYCIPSTQAKILAFDGSFTTGPAGNRVTHTYTEASEENVKSTLASFGAAASQHTDSVFFFFLSSHGNVYAWPASTCGPLRTYGSFSALHATTGAQDGYFDDCELGAALNANFSPSVRMLVSVDCSFCGGFSDSLTAVSGTVDDGAVQSAGVVGNNRVVWTGCAMTTECFGGGPNGGGVFYDNLDNVRAAGIGTCDGWSAPGFPGIQGFDVPVRGTSDGTCTASEWFFAAVWETYTGGLDPIAVQQQYRIKYCLPTCGAPSLAADLKVFG